MPCRGEASYYLDNTLNVITTIIIDETATRFYDEVLYDPTLFGDHSENWLCNICTIWLIGVSGNWKIVGSNPKLPNGLYTEITYNTDVPESYLDQYKTLMDGELI